MGQIIQLPVRPAVYPDIAARLDGVESVLLTAIRWWVDARRRDEDPMPGLSQGLGNSGACDTAVAIDTLMTIVARTLREPIAIRCPRCPHLSGDEKQLLHLVNLMQSGDGDLAAKALRTALLSAQGAEFALGPLQDLAGLLAEAGMFFRKRRQVVADQPRAEVVEFWRPLASQETTQ